MIKVLTKHTSAAYDSGASLRNNSSREELGECCQFTSFKFFFKLIFQVFHGTNDGKVGRTSGSQRDFIVVYRLQKEVEVLIQLLFFF